LAGSVVGARFDAMGAFGLALGLAVFAALAPVGRDVGSGVAGFGVTVDLAAAAGGAVGVAVVAVG